MLLDLDYMVDMVYMSKLGTLQLLCINKIYKQTKVLSQGKTVYQKLSRVISGEIF